MSTPDDDTYFPELKKRIDAVSAADRGEPVLAALHEVVNFAKAHHDGDTVAEFARRLIKAGSLYGRIDYEMIGFGEVLHLYQTNANFADLRTDVLWYYKWLAEHLPEHLDVPAAQVWSLLDQMEAFYRQEKEGLRPVHALRCRAAAFMGMTDEAKAYYEQWQSAPPGETDDCPACETHANVEALLRFGKLEDALAAAEPILTGQQRCEEVPVTTFSMLLFPMVVAGRTEDAVSMHMFARRAVRHVPKFIGSLADHVMFLSLIDAFVPASRHVFVMLAKAVDVRNDAHRFDVARAAWFYFARAKVAGAEDVLLPRRTPLGREGKPVPVDDAIAHYEAETRALAEAFDRRNGTTRFTERSELLAKLAAAKPPAEG